MRKIQGQDARKVEQEMVAAAGRSGQAGRAGRTARSGRARARRMVPIGMILAGACGGLGVAASATPAQPPVISEPAATGAAWPSANTIVDITGTPEDGFSITHYDGTVLYPPTLSESTAECGEYDTLRARVRCRAEVRTHYADLVQTRRAIRWARYDASR